MTRCVTGLYSRRSPSLSTSVLALRVTIPFAAHLFEGGRAPCPVKPVNPLRYASEITGMDRPPPLFRANHRFWWKDQNLRFEEFMEAQWQLYGPHIFYLVQKAIM